MAKKFGKFIMTTAALGALAAGAYYFLQRRDEQADSGIDEDDDFDDFDEDLDAGTADEESDRKYVDLDLTKAAEAVADKAEEKAEEFKEGLDAAKTEATDKIVGAVEDVAKAADNAETKVEEFFDDEDEEELP